MAQDLKNTLLLPKTEFPMRANLVKREPSRITHWEKLDLYAAIQKNRAESEKTFVLHDGPPFTNGDVHIGTALNKTLKDIVNRFKSMEGYRTPYVPGWDCHGLPIEQKVVQEIREQKLDLTTAEVRARCDAFSEKWIETQKSQFKRVGVLADWDNEYKTKSPQFEAEILRNFASFADQDIVFRSKKPVYWSIPFETALAEAEIEYKDHTAIAIWVKFTVPTEEATKFNLPSDKPLSIVIWTTTPWTIPANMAIALHANVDYVVADLGEERILVAGELLESVATAVKLESTPPVVHTVKGADLEKLALRHPFIDRASPVVLADYVTTESGTGCVHTAPGHGGDDYVTGLKNGLNIYCPVADDGTYLDDGQIPADLVGLSCLECVEDLKAKKPAVANIAVLKKLSENNALLAKQKYVHSYPHCWRSKTPIIFRAVDQWFVTLDKAGHRGKALAEITKIAENHGWIPAWGEARIRGAVESRPDWCISRQRTWGVPIPAFFDADKKAYLDGDVTRAVADKIATLGSNAWYDLPASEILDGIKLPADWPAASELTCGRDTLDVWIDSGSSHSAVLKQSQGNTRWPADLYLEGSDQHRGWFQSSLWTGVIAHGSAPYKAVLTHGFIVDKDRQKISKSSTYQKPQTSEAYISQYGADVIRLWIASQDFRDDIPVDDEILKNVGESYRLIRNTLRFQLSNLFDFNFAAHGIAIADLDVLDRWALQQTAKLIKECTTAYQNYEFHRVYQLCNQFCSVTLSATYHDILKDRLYTLGASLPQRRSSQTAIHHIFDALVKLLAPVLCFTADEAWSYRTSGEEYIGDSVHLQDWPGAPEEWSDETIAADFGVLLRVRSLVNERIEPARQAGTIGKSLDASITLQLASDDPAHAALAKHLEFLPELFIVSQVTLDVKPDTVLDVSVSTGSESGLQRCPRCWRWVSKLLDATEGENTCPRCTTALNS